MFTAVGIGNYANQKAPMLMRRLRGTRTAQFVTVYDLSGTGEGVSNVQVKTKETIVHVDGKTHRVVFGENGLDFH